MTRNTCLKSSLFCIGVACLALAAIGAAPAAKCSLCLEARLIETPSKGRSPRPCVPHIRWIGAHEAPGDGLCDRSVIEHHISYSASDNPRGNHESRNALHSGRCRTLALLVPEKQGAHM